MPKLAQPATTFTLRCKCVICGLISSHCAGTAMLILAENYMQLVLQPSSVAAATAAQLHKPTGRRRAALHQALLDDIVGDGGHRLQLDVLQHDGVLGAARQALLGAQAHCGAGSKVGGAQLGGSSGWNGAHNLGLCRARHATAGAVSPDKAQAAGQKGRSWFEGASLGVEQRKRRQPTAATRSNFVSHGDLQCSPNTTATKSTTACDYDYEATPKTITVARPPAFIDLFQDSLLCRRQDAQWYKNQGP